MPADFPAPRIAALQDHAARLLESRRSGTDLELLARELLRGFFDLCTRSGLDRVLASFEATDRDDLAEREEIRSALLVQLKSIDLDGGGPRQAKPKQVADCVVAALALTATEEPDRTIVLGGDVRAAVNAAIASAIDADLVPAKLRETIIADARARTEERFHPSFGKMVAQLDDRGLQLIKQAKVPIDAQHAIQHALYEARTQLFEKLAATALDRVKPLIEAANAEAAARLDTPVTLRATPRELAIRRAAESKVPKTPAGIAHALIEALADTAAIQWKASEKPALPYAASKTFAMGDLIEHPKFGRGSVVVVQLQRIEVEFADGKHTLVHAPPPKR